MIQKIVIIDFCEIFILILGTYYGPHQSVYNSQLACALANQFSTTGEIMAQDSKISENKLP